MFPSELPTECEDLKASTLSRVLVGLLDRLIFFVLPRGVTDIFVLGM